MEPAAQPRKPAKAQPWKEYWLAMTKDSQPPAPGGTRHGFAKGQIVIMDGNANGHSLDLITQSAVVRKPGEN
jgi:hypothetical protein